MKRILLFNDTFGTGGVETFIRNLIPFLTNLGHEVHIVTFRDKSNKYPLNTLKVKSLRSRNCK